ncbi:ribosome production factor 1-like protein [Cricetulus griseus]|nr:ribosome production factor 1-like protein [Cricetulus griseus]
MLPQLPAQPLHHHNRPSVPPAGQTQLLQLVGTCGTNLQGQLAEWQNVTMQKVGDILATYMNSMLEEAYELPVMHLYAVLAISFIDHLPYLTRGLRHRKTDSLANWMQDIKASQENLISKIEDMEHLQKEVENSRNTLLTQVEKTNGQTENKLCSMSDDLNAKIARNRDRIGDLAQVVRSMSE